MVKSAVTKSAQLVLAPTDAGGAPRGADMGELQTLLMEYEAAITLSGAVSNHTFYATKAILDADLSKDADAGAIIVADGANNGIYKKVGAAGGGSWAFQGEVSGIAGKDGVDGATILPLSFKGTYNAGTAYVVSDVVENTEGSWVNILASTGAAVPVLPAISNTNWHILAKNGLSDTTNVDDLIARFPAVSPNIGGTVDVDTIVETGVYAITGTQPNAPDFLGIGNYDATLEVVATGGQIIQTVTAAGGEILSRIDDGGGWQVWQSIITRKQIAREPHGRDRYTFIATSDWQPVPGAADDLANTHALFQVFETYHPNADLMLLNGDIVDRASDVTTGDYPAYGYEHLWNDFNTHTPSIGFDRVAPIPGNHDRNATVQTNENYWSLDGYRKHHGDEYYAFTVGNILFIGMGDSVGSTGGEIVKPVLDWFEELVYANPKKNIILSIHQPLIGTHDLLTTEKWFQDQYTNDRIVAVLNAVPNIVGVFYGHVGGGSYDNSTLVEVEYGTTHMNCNLGIPALGAGTKIFYRFMELIKGTQSVDVQMMNVTDGVVDAAKAVSLFFPFPIDVSDGKRRPANVTPPSQKVLRVFRTLDRYRDKTDPYGITPEVRWMIEAGVMDVASDNCQPGEGVGMLLRVPGTAFDSDPDGTVLLSNTGYGVGGGIATIRTSDAEENFDTRTVVYAATSGDGVDSLVESFAAHSDGSISTPSGVRDAWNSGWVFIDSTASSTGAEFVHGLNLTDPFILDIDIYFYPGTGTRVYDWGNSSPVSEASRYDGSISFKDANTITLAVGNSGVFAVDNVETGATVSYPDGHFLIVANKRPGLPVLP